MFALIGTFFKEKILTTAGIFLLFFTLIIGVFVLFNSNVILSKFGFETTTVLKSELVKSQDQVEKIADANKNTVDTLAKVEETNKKQLESISSYYKEKEATNKKVTSLKNETETKRKVVNAKLEKSTTKTKTTITYNIEDYNSSSSINIIMLNTAYDMLITEDLAS